MALFEQGDIIKVSFDPSLGHEPQKLRPGVVVSTTKSNLMSSLAFVAPITSIDNKFPLHVKIVSDVDVRGYVCVEQTRSLDLSARSCEQVGKLNDDDMSEILERLGAIFGL
ncbi:MAG: type II toxin-antitoxin system PemK/MazF family toxin [Coriobacteriia bacterium]|nr:type II toxin-antitoxin system PemK/MazF family toxin [Coriobacteriia bacterium]